MKFGMFEAMRFATEKFGSGKVTISLEDKDRFYAVRLCYYSEDKKYSSTFTMDKIDILDSNILMMQLRFNRALLELERGIANEIPN